MSFGINFLFKAKILKDFRKLSFIKTLWFLVIYVILKTKSKNINTNYDKLTKQQKKLKYCIIFYTTNISISTMGENNLLLHKIIK